MANEKEEARVAAYKSWTDIYHKGKESWPVIEQAAISHGFDAGYAAGRAEAKFCQHCEKYFDDQDREKREEFETSRF